MCTIRDINTDTAFVPSVFPYLYVMPLCGIGCVGSKKAAVNLVARMVMRKLNLVSHYQA
jgi:hypothetical protein